MNDGYVVYKCCSCNKCFVLFTVDVKHSEEESRYLTCPYHAAHRNICVVNRFESIKECMEHDSYKRVNGKIRQR